MEILEQKYDQNLPLDKIFLFYHKNIEKESLLINNELNPKLEQIFKEWFAEFTKGEEKMDMNACSDYISKVTGVREVTSLNDSRVIDVIAAAGGLTGEADTSVINLSKKITDEMVIIVYSKTEVADFHKTKQIEEQVQEKCIQQDEEALVNNACISSEVEVKKTGKISINTASKEELMTLPGIGESKAKDIISYREKNGPFKSVEDIKKVTGVGDSIFAQIKENITV